MIERAVDAHGRTEWVVAGGGIADNAHLRRWLEEQALAYVVPARSEERVIARDGSVVEAGSLARRFPESAWTRIASPSAAQMPDEPPARGVDAYWTRVPLTHGQPPVNGGRWDHSLLIRRSPARRGRLGLYRCHSPTGTTLADLVRVAGAGSTVRACADWANQHVGLDQYQVRRYRAWYRHVTLSLVAAGYLTVVRQRR
jgi:SRSO17 transposase